MTEWVAGTSTDRGAKPGKVYILAKDEGGTLQTQAVASSPEIAAQIVKHRKAAELGKDRYLGDLVWMGTTPRCPIHLYALDLEWQNGAQIMWICGRCRADDAKGGKR